MNRIVHQLYPRAAIGRAFRAMLMKRLAAQGVVQGGPFRGLRFPGHTDWSGLGAKLLGVYESELYPVLEAWRGVHFSHVLDIGAADGYYALGCARLWPEAKIIAYETSPEGRAIIASFTTLNELHNRIEIRGTCEPQDLRSAAVGASAGLLIMDVEGYEEMLLTPDTVEMLRRFHAIIELHDLRVQDLTRRMQALFGPTHDIREIWTRPREGADFAWPRNHWLRQPLLRQLKHLGDEARGSPMRWYAMEPKTGAPKQERCGAPSAE